MSRKTFIALLSLYALPKTELKVEKRLYTSSSLTNIEGVLNERFTLMIVFAILEFIVPSFFMIWWIVFLQHIFLTEQGQAFY